MDRFKFRFWDIINNKYIAYSTMPTDGKFSDNVIPEQCTGFKDKNGKLVYEGDIVKWYESELKRIEEVFFDEKLVEYFIGFKDKLTRNFSIIAQKCEVIGNIHENADKA